MEDDEKADPDYEYLDDVDHEPASGRVSVVTVPSGRLLRKHNPLSDLQTLYNHLYKQHPICWGPDTYKMDSTCW